MTLIVLIGFCFFFIANGLKEIYNNSIYNSFFETEEYEEDWDDEITADEYNNGISKGKIVDLYYEVPIYYALEYYNKDEKGAYKYKYGENSYCSVELGYENRTMEEYMNSINSDRVKWVEEYYNEDIYKNYSVIDDEKIINNYYVISKYDKVYTITFKEYNDLEEKCSSVRNELLRSVRYNQQATNEELDIA